MALGGFALPFDVGCWMLDVGCSVFTISLPNTTRLPRRPRGGLGAPWTNPGQGLVHRTPSEPCFRSARLIQLALSVVASAKFCPRRRRLARDSQSLARRLPGVDYEIPIICRAFLTRGVDCQGAGEVEREPRANCWRRGLDTHRRLRRRCGKVELHSGLLCGACAQLEASRPCPRRRLPKTLNFSGPPNTLPVQMAQPPSQVLELNQRAASLPSGSGPTASGSTCPPKSSRTFSTKTGASQTTSSKVKARPFGAK